MKKLLLATSALVVTAGMAAADTKWSGSAQMGIASEAGLSMDVYSGIDLKFSFSGTADNGMEFGGSLDIDAKSSWYDIGDWEWDFMEDKAGTSTNATSSGDYNTDFGSVYVAMGGFKATFDYDGIDDLYDDDWNSHDVQLSYAAGGISIDITTDVNEQDGAKAPGSSPSGSGNSSMSYKIAYSGGAFDAYLKGNDASGCAEIGGGYSTGQFSVSVKSDQNCDGVGTAYDTVNTIKVGYSADAFSASLEVSDNDEWTVAVDYSADSISVHAETDEGDNWELTGEMDAGGGLKFVAGLAADDSYYLGGKLAF
jgi:outer membrane protein OmpU